MAREKSAVLWGSAVANEVIQKIVEAVQDSALPITPDEALDCTRNNKELSGKIARLIYNEAIPPLFVVVDYDRPIQERIKEGNYDERSVERMFDLLITEGNLTDLPSQGEKGIEIRLIHPRWMEELDTMGLRPVSLSELLPLRTKCPPEKYGRLKIFALGTSWKSPGGDQLVACLNPPKFNLKLTIRSFLFDSDSSGAHYNRLAVTPKEH